uniref:Uncharacterized protein n=1 Tax=Arundo donax TaxID=35708 RepID=A0A0A9FQ15_ARUDO
MPSWWWLASKRETDESRTMLPTTHRMRNQTMQDRPGQQQHDYTSHGGKNKETNYTVTSRPSTGPRETSGTQQNHRQLAARRTPHWHRKPSASAKKMRPLVRGTNQL